MDSRLCTLLVLILVPFIFADDIGDGHGYPLKNLESDPLHLRKIFSSRYNPFLRRLTKKRVAPHIVGGGEAVRHAYPHAAMLRIIPRPGVARLCGGCLIAPEWILTAAHCVSPLQLGVAALGSHERASQEMDSRQTIKIEKAFLEEDSHKHKFTVDITDIALVKLESPAKINHYVQPIRLPALSQKHKNLAGIPAEIVGWGKYSDASTETSPVLRAAAVTLISNEDCALRYPHKVTPWRICSDGSNNTGPCGGDSGGAVFITEADNISTVVGIVSFVSSKGCEAGEPAVYTRVDVWLDWINQISGIPLR